MRSSNERCRIHGWIGGCRCQALNLHIICTFTIRNKLLIWKFSSWIVSSSVSGNQPSEPIWIHLNPSGPFLNCILLPSDPIWTHLNPSDPFLNCILLSQWQSPIWILPKTCGTCFLQLWWGKLFILRIYMKKKQFTLRTTLIVDSFISSFRNNFKNVIILKNSFHFSDSNFCLCALWYW